MCVWVQSRPSSLARPVYWHNVLPWSVPAPRLDHRSLSFLNVVYLCFHSNAATPSGKPSPLRALLPDRTPTAFGQQGRHLPSLSRSYVWPVTKVWGSFGDIWLSSCSAFLPGNEPRGGATWPPLETEGHGSGPPGPHASQSQAVRGEAQPRESLSQTAPLRD